MKITSLFLVLLMAIIATAGYGRDLVFYTWSDTHFGACDKPLRLQIIEEMNALPGRNYPSYYDANAVVAGPAFLLHLGDITESSQTSQWDDRTKPDFYSYMQTVKHFEAAPNIYEVLGNHDCRRMDAISKEIVNRHGNTYYSFDADGVHFVVLNTYTRLISGQPDLDANELDWLKKDLASLKPSAPVIIASHIPLGLGGGRDSSIPAATALRLEQILSKNNILALLHGHGHNLSAGKWKNFDVVSPSGFGYGIKGCSCSHGNCNSVWGVVRITDNRMTILSYDWQNDHWGDGIVLDKTFIAN